MSEPTPKEALTVCAMALGILREDNEQAWTPLSLTTRTLVLIDVLYAMQECDECGRPMHDHDGYTGDNRETYVCNADPDPVPEEQRP